MVSAQEIDALLPQTQCTKCGYNGCLPYAQAIADDGAPINRCPPGGEAGIAALAALLGRPVIPLDTTCGEVTPHRVAVIDENVCIGCAKCLKPCPTDAILGANKFMHTVLPQFCTACELCIPACPVDCITMVDHERFTQLPGADLSRQRYQFHLMRLARDDAERAQHLAQMEALALSNLSTAHSI
jgi:electron transport complex protein RnfB